MRKDDPRCVPAEQRSYELLLKAQQRSRWRQESDIARNRFDGLGLSHRLRNALIRGDVLKPEFVPDDVLMRLPMLGRRGVSALRESIPFDALGLRLRGQPGIAYGLMGPATHEELAR